MDEKCKECGQALASYRCKCASNWLNNPDDRVAANEAAKTMLTQRPFNQESSNG